MGRLLKLVGIIAGALVALLVVAAVLVGFLFDPNDYKDRIVTAVANATGRELTIDGELELELFPNIRIAAGAASLSNADGFSAENFASIDAASLRVALLPLLGGRIAVAEASLGGLELNLERDAAGRNNWQDLGGGGTADDPDPDLAGGGDESGGAGDLDLGIDAISISDANVTWRDGATGTEWTLTDFAMDAQSFGFDATFPLEIAFAFAGPDIDVDIEAGMNATLDIGGNTYRLDDLDVSIDGSGAAWPGGAGEADVSFASFIANLDQGTLDLQDLNLSMLGLEIAGTLQGADLFTDLSLTGGIQIAEFDPNDLLDAFDVEIETADDAVFRRASARADFVYDASQMGMRNTEISLDDSTLTGSLGLAGDALRFDLAVDRINIDRYLPPAADDEEVAPDEGSIDEVDLPIEPLRSFTANGSLSLGETKFMNLTMTDARFELTAGDGRMRLTPAASLYGGSLAGTVEIAIAGDSAELSLDQRLRGVDLNGLATDYLNTGDLSGTGNVTLDLASTGSNMGAIRQALTGSVSLELTDGAWEGIDAWYELRRARAVTQGNSAPEREGPPRTTFSNVSASGVVENGVLTTDDLNATLPFMALNGAGTVGIFDNSLDIAATAALVDGPTLQSDPAMQSLAGSELPLTVTGTLDAPSIRPDFGAMVRAQIQSAVDERVDEEREALREEVRQEQEEVREEVEDRVRERLRGIFDR